ncbi:ornithine carbamoyltransferase [Ideonella sp.]|uniref:ornithine carbamoyltransferase n=1 Tax=Ideonella sp. TaxID=1929293 RepID=UPI0035AFF9A2
MHPLAQPGSFDGPAKLPWPDRQTLLDSARQLQRAAQAGTTQPLLRGKKLGLLRANDETTAAQDFCAAAAALGGHVAVIRSAFTPQSQYNEVQDTARLLGRLYDAVECQGLPASLVQQLAGVASIPVYDGLATASHASAELAPLLTGDEPLADKRRYVMQAVLLSTII